jgi:hypothetical protein
VTAVAIASGSSKKDDEKGAKRTGHAQPHRGATGGPAARLRAAGHGVLGAVLDSLAGRLSVPPADLRKAVGGLAAEQRRQRLAAAGLTPAETNALKACRPAHALQRRDGVKKRDAARIPRTRTSRAACDTAAAKSGLRKLRAAAKAKPDLVALKTQLATALATKLGKTPEEVLTAVRAELDQRLTQAVGIGLVTQKGRDLALGCFDQPATCDLAALRSEVRFGHHRRR